MAGRLTQIATRIWTFSSCACTSLSFWRRRSTVVWKRRIWERGYISYKTGLLGVRKTHTSGREWRGYNQNGVFHSLSEHWLCFIAIFIQHRYPVIQVAPILIYVPSSILLRIGAHQRSERLKRPASLQLPQISGSWLGLTSSSHICSSCYSVRYVGGIRRMHISAGPEVYLSEKTVKMGYPQFILHKTSGLTDAFCTWCLRAYAFY